MGKIVTSWRFVFAFLAVLGGMTGAAIAQRQAQTKEGAALVVEGVVRGVFQGRGSGNFLVQIEIARAELGRSFRGGRLLVPAQGEPIYVHVELPPQGNRLAGNDTSPVPAEQSTVRAYLYPRNQGGWDAAYPEWFEQVGNDQVVRNGGPQVPEVPASVPTPSQGGSILQAIGLRAEQLPVSGRLVLRITAVIPDTPAQKAGLEVGDVIVGVDGAAITGIEQFADALRRGGAGAKLAVLNVRDGKTTNVPIDLGELAAAQPAPRQPEAAGGRSLGVQIRPVRVGLRTAIQVTEVQPNSPAQHAGIEPGDVILDANGTAISDLNQLVAEVAKSGPVLTLKVLDPRSRKEVPVQVQLGEALGNRPASVPGNTPSLPGGASSQAMGIAIESSTVDLLPVVKVVRVAPGSPADKAGIEAGDAIVALNNSVIFAPDLLEEALKKAGSTFTVTVLDVKTGKKTPVQVNLGQ